MRVEKTVVVYNFAIPAESEHARTLAKFKAPRELIGKRFRGELLEGTGEEVDASALDADGRYRRIATGWGELAD